MHPLVLRQVGQQLRAQPCSTVFRQHGKVIQLAHPAARRAHHEQIRRQCFAVEHTPCVGCAVGFAVQDHAQGLELRGREVPPHFVQIDPRQLFFVQFPPVVRFAHRFLLPGRCALFCCFQYSILRAGTQKAAGSGQLSPVSRRQFYDGAGSTSLPHRVRWNALCYSIFFSSSYTNWTLVPMITWQAVLLGRMTPAAPAALTAFSSTLALSLTSKRRRVAQ